MTSRTISTAVVMAATIGCGTAGWATKGGAGFYLVGTHAINAGIVPPPGTYA